MYNRYIPQPDGSYHRKRMEEPRREPPRPVPVPPEEPRCTEEPRSEQAPPCPSPQKQPSCLPENTGSFLRQLLPRDFDTGDLIVIIFLLLIAGDSEKERSSALLTLALYFIM